MSVEVVDFKVYFGVYCYICPVCAQLNIKDEEELFKSGIIFKKGEKNGK